MPRRRIPRRVDLWPRVWRRKPLTAILLVAAVAAVIAVRSLTAPASDHDRYHNRMFRCVRVVDGDTIDIDVPDRRWSTTRIRLWGVDTPETSKSPHGEMYYGPEASAFTKSCVQNKNVRIVLAVDQTRDKYGRLLVYVYFDDPPRMLNEEIIRGGYGYADTRFAHVWSRRFRDLEARAHKEGLGLWGKVTLDQMPEWRRGYETWKATSSRSAGK